MKWTKVLRTGALGVRFMGVDLSTIMFNMEQGQDMTEVCFFPPHTGSFVLQIKENEVPLCPAGEIAP